MEKSLTLALKDDDDELSINLDQDDIHKLCNKLSGKIYGQNFNTCTQCVTDNRKYHHQQSYFSGSVHYKQLCAKHFYVSNQMFIH